MWHSKEQSDSIIFLEESQVRGDGTIKVDSIEIAVASSNPKNLENEELEEIGNRLSLNKEMRTLKTLIQKSHEIDLEIKDIFQKMENNYDFIFNSNFDDDIIDLVNAQKKKLKEKKIITIDISFLRDRLLDRGIDPKIPITHILDFAQEYRGVYEEKENIILKCKFEKKEDYTVIVTWDGTTEEA